MEKQFDLFAPSTVQELSEFRLVFTRGRGTPPPAEPLRPEEKLVYHLEKKLRVAA